MDENKNQLAIWSDWFWRTMAVTGILTWLALAATLLGQYPFAFEASFYPRSWLEDELAAKPTLKK